MADLVFPRELTPELLEVLGMMNFRTGPIARAFRDAGRAEIPRKCADEKAFVLHWLVKRVLEHGADWRRPLFFELDQVIAEAKLRRADDHDRPGARDG